MEDVAIWMRGVSASVIEVNRTPLNESFPAVESMRECVREDWAVNEIEVIVTEELMVRRGAEMSVTVLVVAKVSVAVIGLPVRVSGLVREIVVSVVSAECVPVRSNAVVSAVAPSAWR